LEENSAQPLNPREGLITIPFNWTWCVGF
jgi:hypothetical protein